MGSLVRRLHDYNASKIVKISKKGYFAPEVYKVTLVIPSKYPNALLSYKLMERETGKVLTGQFARWQLLRIPEETVLNIKPQERRPGPERGTQNRYVVQSIVDKMRMRNGQVKYEVRWRGYTAKDDTWETRRRL